MFYYFHEENRQAKKSAHGLSHFMYELTIGTYTSNFAVMRLLIFQFFSVLACLQFVEANGEITFFD